MELKNNLTKMRSAITFVLALQLICSGNAFTIFRNAISSPIQSLTAPLFQPPAQPVNYNENQENSVPVEIAERNSDYNQLEEIRTDLNEIKNVLQNNRIDDKARRLPQECVDAILSRNAQLAYKKLKQIDDPTKINWIVKEVYDNNYQNFELIANFCDGIDDLEVIIRTYEALGYEIIRNYDQMDDLNKKLTDLDTIHPESNIGDVITKLEIQFVTKYANKPWHVIPIINKQKRLEIRILEYEIVLKNILSTEENINYITNVIYGLKQTMDNPSFETLDVEIRNKANGIKKFLPPCIKNTYFNDKIYIKSIKYNEYLSSPNPQNKNHSVYANPSKSTWFVKLLEDGEYVGFRNSYDEYLSSEADDDDRRDNEILTYYPEGNPEFFKGDVMWIIEAADDNCYLKNRYTDARLCVTDDNHLVSSQKSYTDDDKYLFTIEPSSGDNIDTSSNANADEPNSLESLIFEVFADVSKEKGSVVNNENAESKDKEDSRDNLNSGVSSSGDDIDIINNPKAGETNSLENLISEVFADIEENNGGNDGTRVTDMYYVDNESSSNEKIPETDILNDKRISR